MSSPLDDPARVQAVWDRLAEALKEMVRLAESRMDERCPYKTRDSLCTFAGGCQNQRRSEDVVRCAGDHLIRRAPDDQP
jgi:hypothetical protein